MKKAKGEGKQAYVSVDKLYFDGTQYVVKTDPIQPLGTPVGATAVTVEPAVVAAGIPGGIRRGTHGIRGNIDGHRGYCKYSAMNCFMVIRE